MSEPKISIRDLRKAFGPKQVLDGVRIDVAAGGALVGSSGSGTGKSVLLKHIIGLLRPDAGSIVVDGQAVETLGNREITAVRRKLGMAFPGGARVGSLGGG